ncbi:MAG: hypothetical protein NDJ89_01195 [Oligoflexia bacterium]|nr:hypothetical protein [Oligoflexia bacterium]
MGVAREVLKARALDAGILAICLALGGSAIFLAISGGYWVGEHSAGWYPRAETGLTAVLSRISGTVRYRPAATPLWRDLFGEPKVIQDGSSVFTGAQSRARLQIRELVLELMPDSLVSLESPRQSEGFEAFRIGNGRVRLALPSRQGALRVATGSKSYLLRFDSRADLSESTRTVELEAEKDGAPLLLRSDFPLRIGPEGALLEKGMEAVLSEGRAAIHAPLAELQAPLAGARILAAGDAPAPVEFRFARVGEKPVVVEIQGPLPAEAFRRLSVPAGGAGAKIELGVGAYRWRVVGQDAARATGWADFEVLPLAPPGVIGPLDGATVGFEKATVRLTWEPLAPGLVPEVRFSGISEPIRGELDGLTLELPPGEHTWQVRTRAESGAVSEWSAPRMVFVHPSASAIPAGIVYPAIAIAAPSPRKLQASPLARGVIEILPAIKRLTRDGPGSRYSEVVEFRWKRLAGANAYEVEIFDRKGGRIGPYRTATAQVTVPSLIDPEKGGYSWRVTAIFSDGSRLTGSRQFVRVEVAPPVLKFPEAGARERAGGLVILTWESRSFRERYRVELARDAGFLRRFVPESAQTRTEGKRNYLKLRPREPGAYYWRVKVLTEGTESAWSEGRHFLLEAPR